MKRTITFFLSFIMAIAMMAGDVTPGEALQQAQSFIQNRKSRVKQAPGTRTVPRLTMVKQVKGLYVFNVENNGGFIIVSNDDRAVPILGYSDSGAIDPNNMPDNMLAWLQGYADEIAWLQQHSSNANDSIPKIARHAPIAKTDITPLVTTKWDQGAPYNNMCPTYSGNNKAVTGCVATAMAQVMNYHQWPQSATSAIPGYITYSYSLNLSDLPATTFDWDYMQNSYSSSATGASADAVAELMQYCGYSVEMDYGPSSGSNTDMVAAALKAYYDYNTTTTQFVSRSMYTATKWANLIYHELANNRPVVYGGMSSGGGHEFVCDGYKYENGTDFFHINWGWSGVSDNYFVLSALDPDQQGIGGSSSNDGFHYGQDAVIGIQPSTSTGTIADITPNVLNLTLNSMTPSSNPAYVNVPVDITLNITNNSTEDYDGDIWLGLKYSSDDYALLEGSNFVIPAGETKDIVIPFTPTATGTYNLVFFLPNSIGSYSTDGVVQTTLTVETPTTNQYVPIYGYYCDEFSRSQFIIPAANLENMLYSNLKGVTFYATDGSVSWGNATFDVYLSEVSETTISELKDWSSLDKVYSGSLSISDGKMVIDFTDSYQYQGGNLLVGINQTTKGSYKSCNWIGSAANGVSLGGYNTSVSQRNFLPMTTFDYTSGEAPDVAKPTDLIVSYSGGTTAEVSWSSTESAWDIDLNGNVIENVTNPYTLTDLEFATTYTVKVRAKNGSKVSEWSSPATFSTELSDDMCQVTLELTDSYGDGWNGAAIQVVDALTGTVISTVTNSTTNTSNPPVTDTEILSVPNGRDINFVWVSGSYDSECSYVVYDVNGEEIFSGSGAMSDIVTYHVDCTVIPWRSPSNLAASEIGPKSVKLSWTENSDPAATAWVIGYKKATDADFTEVNAETNPFTLSGLTPETQYIVKVRPATDEVIKWSKEFSFTTDILCPKPTDLNVTPAFMSATVSWTGDAEGYDLRYREDKGFRYGFETADPWAVDDFAPCTTYDGDGTATYYFSGWSFTNQGYTGACIAFQNDNDGSDFMQAHSGNAFGVMFNPADQSTANDWLILPEITIQEGDEFSFWAREITNNYGNEVLNIGVYGDTDGTFASTIKENLNISETVWTKHTYPLTAYVGQTIRLAINCVSTDIFGVMLDDIYVGNPDSGWTTVENVTSPYDITALNEETTYEVQVLSDYGSEGKSNWCDPVLFTTPKGILLNSKADNNEIIEKYDSKTTNVMLSGHTLYKDSYWNTLCLPFAMTAEQVTEQLAPKILKTLSSASFADGTLTLNFADATTIEAGKPYIIKWDIDDDITNPTFMDVTISNTTSDINAGVVTFKGLYAPVIYAAGVVDKSVLFMKGDDALYYPNGSGVTNIDAFHAYFILNGITAGDIIEQEGRIVLNFDDESTSISLISNPGEESDSWYTIDGRRLNSKPTKKGIYIVNGKKVVIK